MSNIVSISATIVFDDRTIDFHHIDFQNISNFFNFSIIQKEENFRYIDFFFVLDTGERAIFRTLDPIFNLFEFPIPVWLNEKNGYQYLSLNQKKLIPNSPVFREASRFYQETRVAIVSTKEYQFNIIDENINFLSDSFFKEIQPFFCGHAIVCNHNLEKNFIAPNGKLLLENFVPDAIPFSNSIASVQLQNKRWIYIDPNGKPLFNQEFLETYPFSSNSAVVQLADKSFNFIDLNGNFLFPPETFKNVIFVSNFQNGFATVQMKNKKWTFLSENGKFLTNPIFRSVSNFSPNVARVQFQNKTFNYINKNGQIIFPQNFQYAPETFDSGYAIVSLNYDAYQIVAETGQILNQKFKRYQLAHDYIKQIQEISALID